MWRTGTEGAKLEKSCKDGVMNKAGEESREGKIAKMKEKTEEPKQKK